MVQILRINFSRKFELAWGAHYDEKFTTSAFYWRSVESTWNYCRYRTYSMTWNNGTWCISGVVHVLSNSHVKQSCDCLSWSQDLSGEVVVARQSSLRQVCPSIIQASDMIWCQHDDDPNMAASWVLTECSTSTEDCTLHLSSSDCRSVDCILLVWWEWW